LKLGKSQREKEPTKVASIAAFNPDGLLLFGLRNDTEKWTMPGGHFEPGEEPIDAARRELEEETGLKGENFEYLGVGEAKEDLHIYCFRCLVVGDPDGGKDPDEECSEWKWVEAHDIPEEIMSNLHSKKNITLRLLGCQDGEVDEPLEKKDLLMTKPLPVQHYSTTPGLKTLDPKFQGTGAAGQERNRSKRIPRTYYYTRPGTPEAHVASAAHLYHGELPAGTRLYDMGDDKLNLKAGKWKQTKYGMMFEASDLDQVEKKLKKLGYHGYHSYGVKDALAYFHPLSVRHIVAKSEDMEKMAIADIPRGGLKFTTERGKNVFNYSHVLSPEHRGFEVRVEHEPDNTIHATLHSGSQPVGYVRGQMEHGNLRFIQSDLEESFRGKGLGLPLYESVMAHAYHAGARSVSGNIHSSMASRVHQKLAEKHGLEYKATQAPKLPGKKTKKGPYDDRVGRYDYALKSEDLQKTEEILSKGEFRNAGFRHKDGTVVETGAYHNIEPWLLGGSMNHREDGPHNSSDWEAGFVTHAGVFMNRDEAAKHVGLQRYSPVTGQLRNLDSQDPEAGLKKGFLATAALAGSIAMGGALHAPAAPHVPEQHQTVKPQMNEVAQASGIPAWTPEELHPDLIPIAHLESSFGQNMAHAAHKKGEFHTAFGALGFKPVTAHEEYAKSKLMNQKYPGLSSPETFLEKFKNDPKFYNLLASAHFARLKHRHGDPQKAAYAWRWGSTACANATEDQIKDDHYVQSYTAMQLHGKQGQPQLKKTEHDPLEAMLQHENPRERILALKNKHVTPYHLRMALQDEDPEVRAFAARHPKMTAPMIHEALHHEDIYTRKAALSRPDLTPEHIQSVLFDPDLQTLAALHPRCTEEQRSMVTDHHLTPPGLKHELLAKTVGYLMYPRLGQNKVPSTPMIRTPEAHQEIAVVGADKPDLQTAMSHGYVRYNMKRNTPVAPARRKFSMSVKSGPGLLGTLGHETQHGIFAHLKQTYGKEAGHRIVATTLAALDPTEHAHLKKLTDWSLKGYDALRHPEERIAYLQNYLQDQMWRHKAHKAMKILGHRNAEKASHDIAKQIWQKLRIKAQNLTPQEVGVILKTEADLLTEWADLRKADVQVEQIVKSDPGVGYDNTYEDQLGMQPKFEAFLKAAQFLAHTEPDYDLFRQALLSGLDADVAALTSVGLPVDNKNKRAILAVVSLQDGKLNKNQPHRTHEIQALMPDGAEVADGVRRGFSAETDQDLHLGGKHSKGTMMVRDPQTGMMYLLKPGSGKQSPALGAREEGANQSRREAAFWHVADALGLGNRVPRADLLLIDGQEVAALHLLPFSWKNLEKLKFEDPGLPHKALEKYRHTGELHKWAVLDYILGNPDRHGQNLMVGPEKDNHPVALIDHGSAFAGPSFDPARDKNSFIPYYLRAWKGDNWHGLLPEQRLRAMPSLNKDSDEQLRTWLEGVHGGDLEQVLARYGIDPQPSLERLVRIRKLLTEPSVSQAINQLWLATP
jgi:8-oxo-dGTP pyrophosphatase MutT (NUDIX family)